MKNDSPGDAGGGDPAGQGGEVTLTAKNRVTEQPRPISPQPRPGSKSRFCSLGMP